MSAVKGRSGLGGEISVLIGSAYSRVSMAGSRRRVNLEIPYLMSMSSGQSRFTVQYLGLD